MQHQDKGIEPRRPLSGRERMLCLLEGGTPDRPGLMPMTMMFAARQTGAKYGRYALDHNVLVEAQLKTAEIYGFDHVSTITETREAPDCGATIKLFEDQPYALDEEHALLADKTRFNGLQAPDPLSATHMQDRLRAIELLKRQIGSEKMIEGWVEGPCCASSDLRGINRLMTDFMDDPEFVRDLFDFVVELGLRFGKAQIAAGADIVGIGDPASSLVGPRIYEEFVWPYQKRLVDGLHGAGAYVRLHICGNTRRILPMVGKLGCDIIDVDSMVKVSDARAALGPKPLLLGGIDPVRVLQNGTPEAITAAAAECHAAAGERYIAGGGCEIPPDTPRQNMLALAEYVRNHEYAL